MANCFYKPNSETLGYLRSIQQFLAGDAANVVIRPSTFRAHLSKANGVQLRDVIFLENYVDSTFSVSVDELRELWKRDFTEYEDLVTSTFLWQAANDISEAFIFHDLAVPNGITVGSLPVEFANARVLHSPAGTPIIAVNNGFISFLYSMAKSVGLTYIFGDPVDGRISVPSSSDLNLGTEEEQADFAERLSEYVATGYCGDALRDVLHYVDKPNFEYIKRLFRHAFMFVLAHEYAHIALANPANIYFSPSATSIESDASPHWKREFYADEIALVTCLHKGLTLGDPSALLLSGVAILFFFSCAKFIEILRPPLLPESHPPILLRQRRVSLLINRPNLPADLIGHLNSLAWKNASALSALYERTSSLIERHLETPRADLDEQRRRFEDILNDVRKRSATESTETRSDLGPEGPS